MIKRDIFGIIVKAFALYCIVQFIRSTPAVIGAIVIDHPEFITNKPLYILLMSLYPVVFISLAFIFIRYSELIVDFFYAKSDISDHKGCFQAAEGTRVMIVFYPTLEQAAEVHRKTVEISGGAFGHLDLGKLAGVLEHIRNDDYYPSFVDKLPHLFFWANKFHCFEDRNKRNAIALGAFFCCSTGICSSPAVLFGSGI